MDEPRYGDLAVYGRESVTHIAFWLGEGRILHAAGSREVVEEDGAGGPAGDSERFRPVRSPDRFTSFELKEGVQGGRYRGRGRC